ncbi:hypothetical protein AGMMS50222_05050 [Endomicrobiia bacterium]|nr:hypothetical protein AGMMS49556_05150 [Endomicrobiia bacterium]GHT74959.1 hypothetical protein AGMMS50222_05050 [Endomicrobiia bacterium]
MSMGGAFNAISDDENAFFYNPAGITQREGYLFQIMSIDAALNNDTISAPSDLISKDVPDKDKIIDNFKRVASSKLDVFASAPNILFITSPISVEENYLSFGLGVLGCVDGNAEIKLISIPSLSYNAKATDIQILSVAFKISSLDAIKMPGSLSLGMNLKRIGTIAIEKTYCEEKSKSNVLQGNSFGIDIGTIYHLNPSWNFGLSVTDIYNTGMNYKELDKPYEKLFAKTLVGIPHNSSRGLKNCRKEKINPEVNIGASWCPKEFYYWPYKYWDTDDRLALALDLTDLTNLVNHDESFFGTFFKNLHMGVEYKYNPFVIRAGYNSGYPTIGFGLVSNSVQLEYAFYGEKQGVRLSSDPTYFHRAKFSVKLGNNIGKRYGKSRCYTNKSLELL